ncbi:response regulator transcription factor [Ferruginibacter paludis]|uniref:response regulator transcription factor n=1 Tax=Ferruginibacter paludis TaxID=1310417 RepID=UPI0025B3E011|nr:response regulator transcription factor [Ferruginibacter paludis]MDN3658665.1 response regulator transcription factor [Ferruginibacter paludis]
MTTIALVDDHKIFSDSLASLINDFEGFTVCWSAQDGAKAIQLLQQNAQKPDIVFLDIVMPGMSGLDVAKWICDNKKDIKVLALTMEEDDNSVIQMLQYGVRGYLLKNIGAEELRMALEQVVKFGYYYTPIITSNIHKHVEKKNQSGNVPEIKDREKELLNHLCTEMPYAEIAKKMFLSESTVDTYRARLFEKFEVKNRIGLILKAVNMGLVKL